MSLISWIASWFRKRKNSSQLIEEVYGRIVDDRVTSPYGVALSIDEELTAVESAFQELERNGKIRRSAKQIVVPDDGEEIPLVYLCYERAGASR